MIPAEAWCFGALALAGIAYLWGYVTGRCSKDNPCPKCSFHVNEQRVERLTEERKRVEEAERQAELSHNYMHKGAGFLDGDPDKFRCSDEACERNRLLRPPKR